MIWPIFHILSNRAAASLILTVALLWVAQDSGPESFAPLAASYGAGVLIATLLDLGLTQYTIISVSAARNRAARRATVLAKYSSLATTLFVATVAWLLGLGLVPACLLAGGVALDRYSDNWNAVLLGRQEHGRAGLLITVRRVIFAILFVTLLVLDVDAVAAFCGSFALAGVLIQFLRAPVIRSLGDRDLAGTREVLRESRNYWVATTANQVREVEPLLILVVASSGQAGLFSAAQRFVKPVSLISSSIANVLLATLQSADVQKARRVSRTLLISAVGVSLLATMMSPLVTRVPGLVLGEDFRASGVALAVLFIGAAPLAVSAPLGSILQARGATGYVARNGLVFSVLGVVAVATGAGVGGATGAATGAVVSLGTKCLSLAWRIEKLDD